MKLTTFSENRFKLAASRWTVAREYYDPLYNYLVHGFSPGSFWEAVLANDFGTAVLRSHPANDIPALKHVVGWMRDQFPINSYGSYQAVDEWIKLDPLERRMCLESKSLVYTEQEEIMLALSGRKPTQVAELW